MSQSTASEFLTEQQAADLLHVTTRTLLRWRTDGFGGPVYCRVGPRRVLYARATLDAWIASRTYAHRAAEAVAA
jgi:hypothetical protein